VTTEKHYLGDAVNASTDGEYIILETGNYGHQRIYLDRGVYRSLVEYAESIGWSMKPEQQR
jgi:Holliday junction resolvase